MKPFRPNVAIAIDGGGIRGAVPARALAILEDELGRPANQIFRLAAGTSTGSILSAGIAVGRTGHELHQLYVDLGQDVFTKSVRTALWPLFPYRYPHGPLRAALTREIGALTMGDVWRADPAFDVVITAFDLVENRTRFIKPWKSEYTNWPLVEAVLASCSVPTYFPTVAGRYVDGGVGSYTCPSYVAAYELCEVLCWNPAETTLISLGTGRAPHSMAAGRADHFWSWQWLKPIMGAFMQSAYDQQIHLVDSVYPQLDFRRFQVDLDTEIAMDDPSTMDQLTAYGDELGRKILTDETDPILEIRAGHPPDVRPGRAW